MTMSCCPGHAWYENGQSAFYGPAFDLYMKLDAMFVRLARRLGAVEHHFPSFIPAKNLAKMNYFHSFPHAVTFPVSLDRDEENLEKFRKDADRDALAGKGLTLTNTIEVKDVLTPAACYHFYPMYTGKTLDKPMRLTTRAQCHRRENYYEPLRRQWSFGMREIVTIGTAEEARAFIEQAKVEVAAMLDSLGLSAVPTVATDPFFRPEKNAAWLMQKLDPVKTEFVFGGDLAVASANLHYDHFGAAFEIAREGRPAHTACLAFGLERWVHMILKVHGTDPADWILPDAVQTHTSMQREPVMA